MRRPHHDPHDASEVFGDLVAFVRATRRSIEERLEVDHDLTPGELETLQRLCPGELSAEGRPLIADAEASVERELRRRLRSPASRDALADAAHEARRRLGTAAR